MRSTCPNRVAFKVNPVFVSDGVEVWLVLAHDFQYNGGDVPFGQIIRGQTPALVYHRQECGCGLCAYFFLKKEYVDVEKKKGPGWNFLNLLFFLVPTAGLEPATP